MPRNYGHMRRTNHALAAVDIDPFGPDGFGDTWNKSPRASFDSDSDDSMFQWQEVVCSDIDISWTRLLSRAHDRQQQADAAKRAREEFIKEDRAAAAVLRAHELKKKAAIEAAQVEEELLEAQAAAVAKQRWDQEIEQAEDALAHAKPVDALCILASLFKDDSFNRIDMKEQRSIGKMYESLYAHFWLQQKMAIVEIESINDKKQYQRNH